MAQQIGLHWDISVSHDKLIYSNGKRKVKLIDDNRTARGPFWKYGRHITQIKIHKCEHVAVGIVNKTFPIKTWIGKDEHSYGLWFDRMFILHNNAKWKADEIKKLVIKQGDIVTIDVDLNNKTLNFAVNGECLSGQDLAFNNNDLYPIAVAVTLQRANDCVEIVDYTEM